MRESQKRLLTELKWGKASICELASQTGLSMDEVIHGLADLADAGHVYKEGQEYQLREK